MNAMRLNANMRKNVRDRSVSERKQVGDVEGMVGSDDRREGVGIRESDYENL